MWAPHKNMANTDQLERNLQRWVEARILDPQAADRIRSFEMSQNSRDALAGRAGNHLRRDHGCGWSSVVCCSALGGPFAHAALPACVDHGWWVSSCRRGSDAAHARAWTGFAWRLGTVALGGGIFLAGQIFNLQEHWPGVVSLWAVGALLSWIVLRDWIQATLAMLLIPAWIASEWSVRAEHFIGMERFLVQFLMLLVLTYLGSRRSGQKSELRRALTWIGGLAVLPMSILLFNAGHEWGWQNQLPMSSLMRVVGFTMAFVLPLALAWFLRGKAAVWNIGFAAWVFAFGWLDPMDVMQSLGLYALSALGAIGLVFWGVHEQRRERINLGVAGFAITIIAFYFSTLIDKLGRSASLVGFGLLFLLGGWKLEQFRRMLVARTTGGTQ